MKVGIIGCGEMALAGHVPAFKHLGLEIAGVADTNKAALQKISPWLNVGEKYTDYEELLKRDLDIVSVCTPPFLHHQICTKAAERGINVLVEKPLALSVEEGIDIKRKAETNGIKLCLVHNYKFLDPILKAKKMQENGQFGRLLSIHSIVHLNSLSAWETWRMNERQAGSMILQWTHPLYLQAWFGGIPRSVFAIGKRIIPDYPSIRDLKVLIDFGDCVGFLEVSEFGNAREISFDIMGSGASVKVTVPVKFRMLAPTTTLDAVEESLASFLDLERLFRMYLTMQFRPYMKATWGSHFRLIKAFIESIEEDTQVPATVDEGILSIRIAKAIEESLRDRKEIMV